MTLGLLLLAASASSDTLYIDTVTATGITPVYAEPRRGALDWAFSGETLWVIRTGATAKSVVIVTVTHGTASAPRTVAVTNVDPDVPPTLVVAADGTAWIQTCVTAACKRGYTRADGTGKLQKQAPKLAAPAAAIPTIPAPTGYTATITTAKVAKHTLGAVQCKSPTKSKWYPSDPADFPHAGEDIDPIALDLIAQQRVVRAEWVVAKPALLRLTFADQSQEYLRECETSRAMPVRLDGGAWLDEDTLWSATGTVLATLRGSQAVTVSR